MPIRSLTGLIPTLRDCPHPTWQSRESKFRASFFLASESRRQGECVCMNIGSSSKRLSPDCMNLDLLPGQDIDVQGDLLALPIKGESIHAIVCTGVLEHVRDASTAVKEIYRILHIGGRAFIEVPFMQTVHASPSDYCRWTQNGLITLMSDFNIIEMHIVAGPGSALAWIFQQTIAMLFSFNRPVLYKIGLRLFGWAAIPISWLDVLLEGHAMASNAASGFSIIIEKPDDRRGL